MSANLEITIDPALRFAALVFVRAWYALEEKQEDQFQVHVVRTFVY